MFKNKITPKILLFLIFSDVLETASQFCFKKSAIPESALAILNIGDALFFARLVISSQFLWLGLISVFLTFVIWSTILSKIDLSVAVPVASFSYILVPLASILFFHEKITLLRWTGILFIIAGIIAVSISSKERH